MTVKKLTNIDFDDFLNCFLQAFEGYFVKMPTDGDYYRERWKASKVSFDYSYGMFDGGTLVGFILHSVDKRNGELIAFNSATGVIPEFRGRRIVKSIYQYALEDLRKRGITKSTLEVITENKKAIRAYQNVGFEKCKTYKCYNGTIQLESIEDFVLEQCDNMVWENLPNQDFYSWENQKESILAGNYTYFRVLNNGQPESFFIIKPDTGYIAQFDILVKGDNSWDRLFSAINSVSAKVKINNVDNRLTQKITILEKIGLDNSIDQFEMVLTI